MPSRSATCGSAAAPPPRRAPAIRRRGIGAKDSDGVGVEFLAGEHLDPQAQALDVAGQGARHVPNGDPATPAGGAAGVSGPSTES
jgi:hypothetical protein